MNSPKINDTLRNSYAVREIIIPGAIAILKGTDADLDRGPYHLVPT